MKSVLPVIAAMMVLAAAPSAAGSEASKRPLVSHAALAAAGRRATLKAIDYGHDYCDGSMSVAEWLKQLVGNRARGITWTGGTCALVNNLRPGFDAATWPYCAQATVLLARPKRRDDKPMIEIYFEQPSHGRPGAAYAFRSLMMTRDDGPDYLRFRKDFEAEWDDRFPPAPSAARCRDPE
jgi:hypothetical protein